MVEINWSVHLEQTFEKMYNLKRTTDNTTTDSHMRIIIEGKLSELKDSLFKLEGNDKVCMVDFRMNDESSINIQDRSNNVISW